MCDLLGMCFNKPVQPKFMFNNFRYKDEINEDGWGLAYYPEDYLPELKQYPKSVQVFKEKGKATNSQLSEFLVTYSQIESRIIISHVRAGNRGDPAHWNTHPFSREFNGKEYVFAHNGTLDKEKLNGLLIDSCFKPIGDTDSERAFCYILHLIKQRKISSWKKSDYMWLEQELKIINEQGNFNCLLSDGEHLFCYSDKREYNKFSYIHRQAPFGKIKLRDIKNGHPGEDIVNLDEEKDPAQKGYIISTTDRTGKPTSEPWESLGGGILKVFKDGVIWWR